MLHRHAVHADEAPPEIVEAHAVLRAPVHVFDRAGERLPAHVAGHFHRRALRVIRRGDRAAAQPRREVNPAVRAEGRAVHAELRAAAGGEAGEQHTPLIGDAVAVRVFQKKHVRRAGHDEPALPRHHPIGESESVGKNRALVHAPVAVRVFEHGDDARRFLPRFRPDGIAAIFRDEQPPALIESDRARRGDQRLCGDQLHAQCRVTELERLERIVGRKLRVSSSKKPEPEE